MRCQDQCFDIRLSKMDSEYGCPVCFHDFMIQCGNTSLAEAKRSGVNGVSFVPYLGIQGNWGVNLHSTSLAKKSFGVHVKPDTEFLWFRHIMKKFSTLVTFDEVSLSLYAV